jgi:hypothetical protein
MGDVGAGLSRDAGLLVEAEVEEPLELGKPRSLVPGLYIYWRALRMACPKDSAQCCGGGNDSNKNHIFGKPQTLPFRSVSPSCERSSAIDTVCAILITSSSLPFLFTNYKPGEFTSE